GSTRRSSSGRSIWSSSSATSACEASPPHPNPPPFAGEGVRSPSPLCGGGLGWGEQGRKPMSVKIILVDINTKMIDSWRTSFEENPEVDIVLGSMLDQKVDAWVTPTNSRGH